MFDNFGEKSIENVAPGFHHVESAIWHIDFDIALFKVASEFSERF